MAYGGLPDFSSYLSNAQAGPSGPAAAPAPTAPQPTGTGNFLTAGLGSGFYGALADVGGLGEAAARAVGADGAADSAAAFADRQRATAATYARPDLEAQPWYSPGGFGYRLAQMIPGAGVAIGGGLAATGAAALAAPEEGAAALTGIGGLLARNAGLLGASAASLPSAVGGNVQASKDYYGDLDQGRAIKALALGLPEAGLQGFGAGKLEEMIAGGVGGGFLKSVKNQALTQAAVGPATEFLTQMMGDPNRPMADRAQDIVSSALQGAAFGAVTAGVIHPASAALHALAKTPVQNITSGSLFDTVSKFLNPVEPTPPIQGPEPDLGFQRPLPGLENLPQQNAPVAPSAPGSDQGSFNFGFPQDNPTQGQLPLVGGSVQSDMFGGVFPNPNQTGFDNGVRTPQRPLTAPDLPEGDRALPGMENLPTQRAPVRDVSEGVQTSLDLNKPQAEGEQPVQKRLDFGAFQPSFEDIGKFGNGGFEQGAIPAQTTAYASPQKHLTLEQAKEQAPANRNLPPNDQPPAAQQDLAARLRDPSDPLFKAAGGTNDNTGGQENVREPTPQEPLPLAKPGDQPIANPQAVQDKVTPAPAGPNTRVATAFPENSNDPTRPQSTGDATAQPDATAKPGEIAPANDKFDQTSIQPDMNKIPELRGQTFKTQDEAERVVAKAITDREAAGKVAPPAMERIGKALGVIKDDGSVDPKFLAPEQVPEGPDEKVAAGTEAPKGPNREDIPEKHQGRFDNLQALHEALGDNLTDPTRFALSKRITDLQSELQDVRGSNRTAGITRETNAIRGEIEAKNNADANPPPSDPNVLATTTKATADTQAFIDKIAQEGQARGRATYEAMAKARRNGTKVPKVERPAAVETLPDTIPAVNSPEPESRPEAAQVPLEARTQEATRKAARKAPKEAAPPVPTPEPIVDESPKNVTTPRASAKKIKARIEDGIATEMAKRAKNESQTIQAVENVERAPTPKTPLTPEITARLAETRAALEAIKNTAPKSKTGAAKFAAAVEKHEQQLSVLEKAAQKGGLEALQNFRRDHFDSDLYSDFTGRLPTAGEAALEAHANAETNLMDTIGGLRGERPLIRYSVQPTQGDVNLTNVINKTGKLGDALDHIRQNDPSPANRLMASILGRLGLTTDIRMADDTRMVEDTTRKLGEGELIAGSHNDKLNRINVYDGSKVSQTVLHEAIHAATVRALQSGSAAAREVRALFDGLKSRSEGKGFYGLSDPAEMVAEAGSNPQFQQFLKSEPWQIGGIKDAWQALKNGIFRALGMPERVRTAFDQVMDGTQKLMAENPTRAAITGDRPLIVERGMKKLTDAVDAVGHAGTAALMREVESGRTTLTRKFRDGVYGWTPSGDIGDIHAKVAPSLRDYVSTVDYVGARRDTFYKTAAAALHTLEGVSKKGVELINKVAARDFQGIDGSKPWLAHDHLLTNPKAAVLKLEHAQARIEYNELTKVDGGKAVKALEAMRAEYATKYSGRNVHLMWEYARNAAPGLLGKVKGFESDPFQQYDRAYAAHDDPKASQAWMQGKEGDMRAGLKQVHADLLTERDRLVNQAKADDKAIKSKQGLEMPKELRQELDNNIKDARGRFKQLNDLVGGIDRGNTAQGQSPYGHLGRDGEHFVAANLAKDEGGLVKESAIQALRETLGNGFKDLAIMQGGTSDKFYTRLGSETERNELTLALAKLAKAGHIDDGSISRGLATDGGVFNAISPATMRQVVEAARANPPDIPADATQKQKDAIKDAHDNHVNELMRSMVELIPQTGLNRLYQYREGVQGFNGDMVQNFRKAAQNNSAGLANLTMAGDVGGKAQAMKDQIKALNSNLSIPESQLTSVTQGYNELMGRAQGIRTYSSTSMMDGFRKAAHIFSVGMSPAYVMTLAGQVATNSLPELGSRHGFTESAAALARHTGATFNMVSAVARGPDAATFGVRQSTLVKAGLNAEDVAFHMDMARRGLYSQGYSEAVTGHDDTGRLAKAAHYANAMGRYAEMAPRVQMALAARDLFNRKPVEGFANANDYAYHATNQAQLNWGAATNARQLTRGGVFGVMSPLINQFMGFQTRMTAKLYREVHGALGGDAQSQKWLLGHAAAVAVLSGTLGLPMVSVAASVYDRLADWVTGGDDHDVIASYRTFLASTFGKELGEVIARGAPRSVGIDFDHAGEGSIAPGSTTLMMLTEKRKMEDAERDWLKSEGGHAVGFMFHLASAARDFTNGDYLDASEKMTPELLKGAIEAYRLGERGFVDKNGQKLPITANASDIMQTALGLDPAKEAEYDEEAKTATGLNQMRQLRSQNITRHLLLAQSRGDQPMFQQWEQEATQFQLDHPGMAGPLQDFGRELSMHAKAVATARGFGTPLGIKPRDIIGRDMTSFGNLRNGE